MEDILVNIKGCSFQEEFKNKTLVSINDLLDKIENLVFEKNHLIERIADLKQDRDDNYKRIDVASQCGISNKDFI